MEAELVCQCVFVLATVSGSGNLIPLRPRCSGRRREQPEGTPNLGATET